jgi:hypothetical protein
MQTYKTINEAFKNGTGDVFFLSNKAEYIALNRHTVDYNDMFDKGYDLLNYAEVLEIAALQTPTETAPIITPETQSELKHFFHSRPDREVLGYYDEFPEFYNNNGL